MHKIRFPDRLQFLVGMPSVNCVLSVELEEAVSWTKSVAPETEVFASCYVNTERKTSISDMYRRIRQTYRI